MIASEEIEIFILTGGKSKRMGQPKATLPYKDKNFITQIIQTLAVLNRPITLVGKHDIDALHQMPCIEDIEPHRGALGGIYTALHHCKFAYCLIVGVDMPCIRIELIWYLLNESKTLAPTLPYTKYHRYPFPGIYPATSAHLPLVPSNKIMEWLHCQQVNWVDCSKFETELQNINTPNDYLHLIHP